MGDDDSREDGEEVEGGGTEADSNGVDSDAVGLVVLVFASRLQTGQNVLHDVSHVSTQTAWNSVKTQRKKSVSR